MLIEVYRLGVVKKKELSISKLVVSLIVNTSYFRFFLIIYTFFYKNADIFR